MKARILDTTWVFAEMDPDAEAVASLQRGSEVELGEAITQDDQDWVPISWGEEESGYIRGDTQVFVVRQARVMQKTADLYTAPGSVGVMKEVLSQGERLEMLDILDLDEGRWVRVRDAQGNEGYLSGKTRIRLEPLPARKGAAKAHAQDPDKELLGWSLGLMAMGALSIALSQHLNMIWGVVLIALGLAVLVIRRPVMFLLIGAALITAGALNIATHGFSAWLLLALLQVVWGFQQIRRYRTVLTSADKGEPG